MVLGDVLGLAAPCALHAARTGAVTSTATNSARAISRRPPVEISTRPPRPVLIDAREARTSGHRRDWQSSSAGTSLVDGGGHSPFVVRRVTGLKNLGEPAIPFDGRAECLSHEHSKEDYMASVPQPPRSLSERRQASDRQPGGVSRRKAMLTGAGLVVAGTVAGAAGGVLTTQLLADDRTAGAQGSPKLPVMVYLRDASTGHFDVFVGPNKLSVVDTNFAARLVKAAEATA
jgi:hypothetical protein